jgi:uncharacterized membrane protein
MSWNPNQGQDPNQPGSQYGGYTPPQPPPQPTDPYSGQQGQYGSYQQGPSQQEPYGQQQYGQPPYGQQQQSYQQPYGAPYAAASGTPGSTMNMQQNTAAGLSYLFGWITGLIFFLMEKQNRFVRFHAMQSILFFGGLTVLEIALNVVSSFAYIPLFFTCVYGLIGLVGFVGWIVLMVNGFQGKYFKLPVIGDYAEKYANQGTTGV